MLYIGNNRFSSFLPHRQKSRGGHVPVSVSRRSVGWDEDADIWAMEPRSSGFCSREWR